MKVEKLKRRIHAVAFAICISVARVCRTMVKDVCESHVHSARCASLAPKKMQSSGMLKLAHSTNASATPNKEPNNARIESANLNYRTVHLGSEMSHLRDTANYKCSLNFTTRNCHLWPIEQLCMIIFLFFFFFFFFLASTLAIPRLF